MASETFERPTWAVLPIPGPGRDFVVASGESFEDRDPTTQDVVAQVRASTVEDVDAAVERADRAFRTARWRNDGAIRARVLYRFAERLRDNTATLAELLTREQGKTIGEARSEIIGSAEMVEYYAGLAR